MHVCPWISLSLRPLLNPQGAGCLLHCLQSADVKVFSPLHLLKAPISSLHASFTLRSQSSVFSGHQGELETEAHQPPPLHSL